MTVCIISYHLGLPSPSTWVRKSSSLLCQGLLNMLFSLFLSTWSHIWPNSTVAHTNRAQLLPSAKLIQTMKWLNTQRATSLILEDELAYYTIPYQKHCLISRIYVHIGIANFKNNHLTSLPMLTPHLYQGFRGRECHFYMSLLYVTCVCYFVRHLCTPLLYVHLYLTFVCHFCMSFLDVIFRHKLLMSLLDVTFGRHFWVSLLDVTF